MHGLRTWLEECITGQLPHQSCTMQATCTLDQRQQALLTITLIIEAWGRTSRPLVKPREGLTRLSSRPLHLFNYTMQQNPCLRKGLGLEAHVAAVGEAAGGLDAALQQAARDEVQAQAAAGRRDRADLPHHAVYHILRHAQPSEHL